LAAYKQEHSKALPQHQELHMGMLSRTETELKDVEREYKTAQEELRFLDLELSAAKAGITPKTGAAYSPRTRRTSAASRPNINGCCPCIRKPTRRACGQAQDRGPRSGRPRHRCNS
jgi:hypothetical protein